MKFKNGTLVRMSVSLPWTQRGRRASLSRGPTQTKLSGLWQASRSATLAQNDLAFSAVSVQLPLLSTEISSSVHASKAFVRGTAHASTHNGIKLVSNERRKNLLATVEDGVQYAETFKAACKRKYGNMCRAWRILLNPGGNGRVSFVPFCNAARSMGFVNVSTLWRHLDVKSSGFITLDNWDPHAYRVLMEFREICRSEFGGLSEAFRFGMNKSGSGACYRPEFDQFLADFEFAGDNQVLWDALDKDGGGFITVDELHFLSRWEGQRFRSVQVERDFNLGLARLNICKQNRQKHQDRMNEFKARVKDEQEVLERNQSKRAVTVKQSVLLLQDTLLQEHPAAGDSDDELEARANWHFGTDDCTL